MEKYRRRQTGSSISKNKTFTNWIFVIYRTLRKKLLDFTENKVLLHESFR